MRALLALALVTTGCLRPVVDEVDAGVEAQTDAGRQVMGRDASVPAPEYDPCVWDGVTEGVCIEDTAYVFDGTSCRPICGPHARFGRPGVFASLSECRSTCPCQPEKFVGFELGFFCDALIAVASGGDAGPTCGPPSRTEGMSYQDCLLPYTPYWIDRRALAVACRASALPEVEAIFCFVEL
ncbi:MAG: hypothetical protein Q8N23_36545 [Archangium sp.]|nr:hypothetical protein [Archangium sp.]MDP3572485.1 hypothetical protein [Archangium sp.]